MKNQKKKSFSRRVFLCLLAILLAVCIAFDIYVSDYYHTDPAAEDAMVSDDVVSVTEQNGNWVFAPESPTAGLIFYPGGKVENTAYAPLLHDLAEDGILCVLVKMPCNLAVLDRNAADSIPERFSEVTDWYIGGHSLGGAMAASYAAKHTDELDGLVLYMPNCSKVSISGPAFMVPPGTTMAGTSARARPMRFPGSPLSQLARYTPASKGVALAWISIMLAIISRLTRL